MEDLIGRSFGGYELKEHIGSGGMATIYKGYDEKLARWVAIKVTEATTTNSAEEVMLRRFRLEAQAIARLRHPNILTIFGYGEDDGWAYIIMEFVSGGSLEDRMTNKTFSWQESLQIIIPVAEALALAHRSNIIHRDIKPANILLSDNDWPLLADFGLAKMQQTNSPGLTMPGQVLGTMAYAAPEQIEEGEIDHRVDVYSLAVVLYEMLASKLPFEGETSFDFLMARLTDPPKPLLQANPDAPAAFAPILDKALQQAPDERYQSMDEFVNALKEVKQALTDGQPIRPQTGPLSQLHPVTVRFTLDSHNLFSADGKSRSNWVIGRSYKTHLPDIDLAPHGGASKGVSRQHARLLHLGEDWFIEDLGSTNGTFVNGIRVAAHQMQKLNHRDLVRFAEVELLFEID